MASVTMVMVVTMVMADTDLTSDMRELRGELDQLRSEVTTQKCPITSISCSKVLNKSPSKSRSFVYLSIMTEFKWN